MSTIGLAMDDPYDNEPRLDELELAKWNFSMILGWHGPNFSSTVLIAFTGVDVIYRLPFHGTRLTGLHRATELSPPGR